MTREQAIDIALRALDSYISLKLYGHNKSHDEDVGDLVEAFDLLNEG